MCRGYSSVECGGAEGIQKCRMWRGGYRRCNVWRVVGKKGLECEGIQQENKVEVRNQKLKNLIQMLC